MEKFKDFKEKSTGERAPSQVTLIVNIMLKTIEQNKKNRVLRSLRAAFKGKFAAKQDVEEITEMGEEII